MEIDRIEGQNLVDAIEAMDEIIEAERAMAETVEQATVAVQAVGDRLERYTDYDAMDAWGSAADGIAREIADIRLPDGTIDLAIPLPEPIVTIRAEPGETIGGDAIRAEPPVTAAPSALNFFTRSVPINWGYIDYGSRSIIEIAKSKIKPKPILNPKMVTRRVLNMAEKGWVVK